MSNLISEIESDIVAIAMAYRTNLYLVEKSLKHIEAVKTSHNMPSKKCLCDSCSVGCLVYAGEVKECTGYKSRW